jgi:hypothetical protein
MNLRFLMFISILILQAAKVQAQNAAPACVAVEGDRIRASDLAAADARFAALDPGMEIGFSPRPGVTRVIRVAELMTIARRHQLRMAGESLHDVCFTRAASSNERARAAKFERDVVRGEPVQVIAQSGAARVAFESRAESSGALGDSVLIRNPQNGRLFQAKVAGKGKVVVTK